MEAWFAKVRERRRLAKGKVQFVGLPQQSSVLRPKVTRRFPRTFIIYTHTHKHICRRCRPLVRHTTIHSLTALSTSLPFQNKSLAGYWFLIEKGWTSEEAKGFGKGKGKATQNAPHYSYSSSSSSSWSARW